MFPCVKISNALSSLLHTIITPVLSSNIKCFYSRFDESTAKIIIGCKVEPGIKYVWGVTVTFRFPTRKVV